MLLFLIFVVTLSVGISARNPLPEISFETCDCGDDDYVKYALAVTPNPAILFDPFYLWISYQINFTEYFGERIRATNYTFNNFFNPDKTIFLDFRITDTVICKMAPKLCYIAAWEFLYGMLHVRSISVQVTISIADISQIFCAKISILMQDSNVTDADHRYKDNLKSCIKPKVSTCASQETKFCLNGGTPLYPGYCKCPFGVSGPMCQFPCIHNEANITSECSESLLPTCGCTPFWYTNRCIPQMKDQVKVDAQTNGNNTALRLNFTLLDGMHWPYTFSHYDIKIMDGPEVAWKVRDQVMYLPGKESVYWMTKGCKFEVDPYYNKHICASFIMKSYHRYSAHVTLIAFVDKDSHASIAEISVGWANFTTKEGLQTAPRDLKIDKRDYKEPNEIFLIWSVPKDECAGLVVAIHLRCQFGNGTNITHVTNSSQDCRIHNWFRLQVPQNTLIDGVTYRYEVALENTLGVGGISNAAEFKYEFEQTDDTLSAGIIATICVAAFLVLALTAGLLVVSCYWRRDRRWNQIYSQLLRLKQRFQARSPRGSPPHRPPPRNPGESPISETETVFEPSPQPQSDQSEAVTPCGDSVDYDLQPRGYMTPTFDIFHTSEYYAS